MTINLRTTTLDDQAIVENILAASYGTLMKGFYSQDVLASAVPFMSKAQPALLTSGTYYLAGINGQTGACGGWTKAVPGGEGAEDPAVAHVRHVATHPDHLRKGLARALMAHCFKEAKLAGATRFSCFSSLSAVEFYQSIGFRPIAEKSVAFKTGIQFPMMEMGLVL